MPLYLRPPRPGKSPNYEIRGSYLGRTVERSTGTSNERLAKRALRAIERQIESGAFEEGGAEKGFALAARNYLLKGGEGAFLTPLILYFKHKSCKSIDQAALDAAAAKLKPGADPATINRQIYTPTIAVLNDFDAENTRKFKRPKGGNGKKIVVWLEPDQAIAIYEAGTAMKLTRARALFLFLITTGCRLGEAITLPPSQLVLPEARAWIGDTKNDDPRLVHLPADLVAELANLDLTGPTVFGYRDRWQVYDDWNPMVERAGVKITPHGCRHTWATWMRRYGGLDLHGLTQTKAWKDERSAARYAHVVVSAEAKRADLLPGLTGKSAQPGNIRGNKKVS